MRYSKNTYLERMNAEGVSTLSKRKVKQKASVGGIWVGYGSQKTEGGLNSGLTDAGLGKFEGWGRS